MVLVVVVFTEPALPKPEPGETQTLRWVLPFGIRAASTSHLPLPEPNGRADVWPQQPPGPPPWEPALGLSFSHLHARLGAPGGSHPGVGPPLAIWGDFMAGGRIRAGGRMAWRSTHVSSWEHSFAEPWVYTFCWTSGLKLR